MKKLFPLLGLSSLLILGGCSDGSTTISYENDAIITVGSNSITHGEVYEVLKVSGNVTPVIDALKTQIIEVAVPVTEEVEALAQAELTTAKETIDDEDEWTAFLSDSGYENEDDFYETTVLPTVRKNLITTNYITTFWETFNSSYSPIKLEVIAIDNEEDATTAYEEWTNGTEFEDLKSYANVTEVDSAEHVYFSSDFSTATLTAINETEVGEVVDFIGNDASLTNYYLIRVVENDVDEFLEDAISAIESSTTTNADGLTVEEEAIAYYLAEIDYAIHDATIYAYLISNSSAYSRD